MGRSRLLGFIASVLIFACIGIVILALLDPAISGQIRQTSLSNEYIPLAMSLLDAPMRVSVESENVFLELDVEYSVDAAGLRYFCIYASPENKVEAYDNSRLLVNGSWVIGARNRYFGGRELILPAIKSWCADGKLETGIHLIEFELRDSMFGEPIYTHQWAIEIE